MYSICVLQKQTTTLKAALLSAECFQTKSYLSLKLVSRILQCRALTPLYLGNDTTSLFGNTSTPTQPTMRHRHLKTCCETAYNETPTSEAERDREKLGKRGISWAAGNELRENEAGRLA